MTTDTMEPFGAWTDDHTALRALKARGFTWPEGVIRHKEGRSPTHEEWEAISYLIYQWDFGWEPAQKGPR